MGGGEWWMGGGEGWMDGGGVGWVGEEGGGGGWMGGEVGGMGGEVGGMGGAKIEFIHNKLIPTSLLYSNPFFTHPPIHPFVPPTKPL